MKTTDKYIFFWGGPLSQWYSSFFIVDSIEYNSAEQYMMAQKALYFQDQQSYNKIMESTTSSEQKTLGRYVKNFKADQWSLVSRDIVYQGNLAKFSQNTRLKEMLLKTETKELVETSPYDRIWGIGLKFDDPKCLDKSQWRGSNWLGEVLTKVRDTLQEDSNG